MPVIELDAFELCLPKHLSDCNAKGQLIVCEQKSGEAPDVTP
jgi:hypothetical protein